MSFNMLSLILDMLVLGALGATIFYALRLSKSLENFKQYRDSLGTVIQDLSQNIDKADEAIQKLRANSAKTGDDLQELIDDARMMADELQLINDTGNALATRLENLAQRNGTAARPEELKRAENMTSMSSREQRQEQDPSGPSFFIQDRDYQDQDYSKDEAPASGNKQFQSKAEKELYEALQRNKKSSQQAGGV